MAFTIHLVTRGSRPTTAEDYAVQTFRGRLDGPEAAKVRRLTVHIEETIDLAARPKPKLEWACRVKVLLAPALDEPSFIVEGHAPHAREAVELAADAIEGAVRHVLELASARGHRRGLAEPELEGSKRVTMRRGEPVAREDLTPARHLTAHPPRGRHFHLTRVQAAATSKRETMERAADATHDPRPSRKSTRKSANRSKRDSNLARRAQRATVAPDARARRAQARA